MTKAITKTFLAASVLSIVLPALSAQTLLRDTGRGLASVGKAAGRASGKVAKKAGLVSKQGGKKAANFSARKLSQGSAKLEEKTR